MNGYRQIILINGLIALVYWAVSYLNWLFFHSVGILPMPVWPAAAVALIAGLYWGWPIAPALAAGTILANHYSLGATWTYAACVAVMNTLGPLIAVWLVKRKTSGATVTIPVQLLWLLAAGLLLAPALTASGGIGSQWLLGMIRWEDVAAKWLRWFLAHSVGALLFVPPVLVFFPPWWRQQSDDNRGDDWLENAGKITLGITVCLALLLWFGDALLKLLWFKRDMVPLAESLLPVHSPQELISRIFVSVTVLFAGGAVSRLLDTLAASHRRLEQSNRALQEGEALQRTLLANLPAGVIIVDPLTRRIENVNEAAAAMFGVPKEQIIGHRCHEFLCPAEEGMCPVCDLGREIDNAEREMICADGSRHPVLKSVKPIQVGGQEKLLECFVDITERKEAEKALRESEELQNTILSNVGAHVFLKDTQYRYTYVNSKVSNLFGLKEFEIIGKDDTSFFSADSVEEITKSDRRVIEHGETVIREETNIAASDGVPRTYLTVKLPLKDNSGTIRGLCGISTDITERKEVEMALRESQERFQELAELLPETILEMDTGGNLTFVNRNTFYHFGYLQEDFQRGLNCFELISTEDRPRALENAKRVMLGEKIGLNEYKAVRKDGSTFPVIMHSAAKLHEGKTVGLRGIVIDITETKKLESQLRQAQKMEAIGTLAGGIAHDFNNILSAILGYAEILTLFHIEKDHPARANLEEILKAANRAGDLVKQILTFSRRSEQAKRPVLLTPIIKEVMTFLRASLPTTIDIRQKVQCKEDTVLADPTQIHQVLMNLCTNAAHAMKERGGVLEIKLEEVELEPKARERFLDLVPGPYVKLSVTDGGQGMVREVMERIFDPYFTTKKQGEGTGLGLAVVHGIVKNLGGAIEIESEVDRGTAFQILLPRLTRELTTAAEETERGLPLGNECILFIDDEETIVGLGKSVLENLGYEVVGMTDPNEALIVFRSQPDRFHLVITDLTMPHMTGLQLAEQLTLVKPDIPIVLCSGLGDKNTTEEAEATGIKEFLYKPISIHRLAETVRQVLNEKW